MIVEKGIKFNIFKQATLMTARGTKVQTSPRATSVSSTGTSHSAEGCSETRTPHVSQGQPSHQKPGQLMDHDEGHTPGGWTAHHGHAGPLMKTASRITSTAGGAEVTESRTQREAHVQVHNRRRSDRSGGCRQNTATWRNKGRSTAPASRVTTAAHSFRFGEKTSFSTLGRTCQRRYVSLPLPF